MIDWSSLPDDWVPRYQGLKLPWSRFLPRDLAPDLGHEQSRVSRIEVLPRSEKAFLYHAMDATTVAWSENWHNIMFLDSGTHRRRSRSRWFVPVIATISEVHPFQELERLSDALGPVFLRTGVFPSVFLITENLKEIVHEAQNPLWLMTETLALSWSRDA